MADEVTTLLDIAKANGSDLAVGLIEECQLAAPEIEALPMRPIKGLNYKTLVRTSFPRGQSFRGANQGNQRVKSTWKNRLVETFIFNPQWDADKAVADAYELGAEAYIALEAMGIVKGAFLDLAQQFYYGSDHGGAATGFPGLVEVYDADNRCVDAGGTTESTCSSIWFVKRGIQDVSLVIGQNGSLQVDPVRVQKMPAPDFDPDHPAFLTMYIQEMLAWIGLQVGSVNSCVRIKKVTEDAGHTLTDDLLAEAIMKFPVGWKPDVCFMTRRSLTQLRQSRTAVNPTGAPAPFPDSTLDGVPIKLTDAILNTETLAL